MNNLIERLRDGLVSAETSCEAADRIEELEAENANIKINCDYAWQNNRILEKARVSAEAERDELRRRIEAVQSTISLAEECLSRDHTLKARITKLEQSAPLPPPPPPRRFKQTFLSGEIETSKSVQNRRDWQMFIKGFKFARGEPNVPHPGDYV